MLPKYHSRRYENIEPVLLNFRACLTVNLGLTSNALLKKAISHLLTMPITFVAESGAVSGFDV